LAAFDETRVRSHCKTETTSQIFIYTAHNYMGHSKNTNTRKMRAFPDSGLTQHLNYAEISCRLPGIHADIWDSVLSV